jgi:DNA-binding XRE family transcriptional regulator
MTSSATPQGKGIHGAIKHLLEEQYAFVGGDRVQDMLIGDLIKIFKQYSIDPWNLEVGQTLWFGVHMDEKPGPGKTLAKMRVVPVILSITHEEDKLMRLNGYSHQEVRRYRVARLLKEAYAQKGVMTQADIAELIGVSAGTIGKDIRAYQQEHGIILPYRGTIHDIGPSLTHKKVIIAKFLQGIPTPDIARMTQHTEEACDRYIKAFKKVRMLHDGKKKPPEIAQILGMSERLANEYVALIEEQRSIERVGRLVS